MSEKPKVRHLKTSISLPEDLQRRARSVAEEHNLSLSEYVKRLVEADLSERRKARQ